MSCLSFDDSQNPSRFSSACKIAREKVRIFFNETPAKHYMVQVSYPTVERYSREERRPAPIQEGKSLTDMAPCESVGRFCTHYLEVKEELLDQYKITRLISRGRYSKIYAGRKFSDKKRVCVKLGKSLADETRCDEYKTQAYVQMEANELNVELKWFPKLENFTFINSHPILVFEFLGKSLKEVLSTGESFNLNQCRKTLSEIAMGLQFLHELPRPIAHCSIKPSNIMFRIKPNYTEAVIIDFSLAEHITTSSTRVFQKIHSFTSPECCYDIPYDTKIDVWALGVLAIIMYTNNNPFEHRNGIHLAGLHMSLLGPPNFVIEKYPEKLEQVELDYLLKRVEQYAIVPNSVKIRDLLLMSRFSFSNAHYRRIGVYRKDNLLFIDLLSKMLVYDPANRLTARAVGAHPFFSKVLCPWSPAPEPRTRRVSKLLQAAFRHHRPVRY